MAIIGLLITLTMGYGITKLSFATGTESYLNQDDAAYAASVDYQKRFGGEANLTVITMDEGHTVAELITNPKNREAIEATSFARCPACAASSIRSWRSISPPTSSRPTRRPRRCRTCSVRSRRDRWPRRSSRLPRPTRPRGRQRVHPRRRCSRSPRRTGSSRNRPGPISCSTTTRARFACPRTRAVFPDDTHAMILTRFDGNLKVDPATTATNTTYDIVENLELDTPRCGRPAPPASPSRSTTTSAAACCSLVLSCWASWC